MKIMIEDTPARLRIPLGIVSGVAAAAFGVSLWVQMFVSANWIYTWWAFCFWGATAFLVWHWYTHLSHMKVIADVDMTPENAAKALNFYQSVEGNREKLDDIMGQFQPPQNGGIPNDRTDPANPLI